MRLVNAGLAAGDWPAAGCGRLAGGRQASDGKGPPAGGNWWKACDSPGGRLGGGWRACFLGAVTSKQLLGCLCEAEKKQ